MTIGAGGPMTTDEHELVRAARRGMDLLDARGPDGWRELLNLSELAINSSKNCVLGQLFDGDYHNGMRALDLDSDPGLLWDYGFCGWGGMTSAWLYLLRQEKVN